MPCITFFPVSGAHFHRDNLVDMKAMNVITQTASELARRDVEQNMDSNIAVRAQVNDDLIEAYNIPVCLCIYSSWLCD